MKESNISSLESVLRQASGSGDGGRGGMGVSGTSIEFNNNLKCRYIMFLSDGRWHGNDFIKQLDVIVK